MRLLNLLLAKNKQLIETKHSSSTKNANLPYLTKDFLYRRLVNAKNANEIMNILHHEDE